MRNKLTNRRVINSIGIGILAAITTATPVFAEIDGIKETDIPERADSDMVDSEETVVPVESQNAEVMEALTDAQDAIQAAQGTLSQPEKDENVSGSDENGNELEGEEIIPVQPEPDAEQNQTEETETTPDQPEIGESESQTETNKGEDENTENESVLPDESENQVEPGQPVVSENPEQQIKEHLDQSSEAIKELQENVESIDQAYAEAVPEIEKFELEMEDPHNTIGSAADRISDAGAAVADSEASASAGAETAGDRADTVADAQAKEYESEAEADAAQEQAKKDAAVAEEAYKLAEAAVNAATEKTDKMKEDVAFLETQMNEAALALESAEAKVGEAQELLRTILAENGIDPDAEFDLEQLQGAAKDAYDHAKQALDLAAANRDSAFKDLEEKTARVSEANTKLEDAISELDRLTESEKDSKTKLESSVDVAETNLNAAEQLLEDYNNSLGTVEKIKFDADQAKDALYIAAQAVKDAQNVKNHADQALQEAQKAAAEAGAESAAAAEKAMQAASQNSLDYEKAENSALWAAEEAGKAAEEAQVAAEEYAKATNQLEDAEINAASADANLRQAQAEYEIAKEVRDNAVIAKENAEAALQEIQESVLTSQMEVIRQKQEDIDQLKWYEISSKAQNALANEMVKYMLLSEGIELVGEPESHTVSSMGGFLNYTCKVYEDGVEKEVSKSFCYRVGIHGIVVVENPDNLLDLAANFISKDPYVTEKKINETAEQIAQTTNDLSAKLDAAKVTLQEKEDALTEALQAQNEAETVKALVDLSDALRAVQNEAKALAEAEEKCRESVENVAAELGELAEAGTEFNRAEDINRDVETAYDKVKIAIEAFADLNVQEVDKSAYNSLVKMYNEAKAEYADALKALENSKASLGKAEEKAKLASYLANLAFRYTSNNGENPSVPPNPGTNENPSTPSEPGSNNPGTDIPGTDTPGDQVPGDGNTGNGNASTSTPDNTPSDDAAIPIIVPVYGREIPVVAPNPAPVEYARYSYYTYGQGIPAEAETERNADTAENLVSVEDGAVPLAEVGKNNKDNTSTINNKKTTRTISDEKVPLADIKTEDSRASWLWILLIALLGATGTELYIRHKEKTEQERKLKGNKKGYAKI